jgi:hypothetical protein
MKLGIKLIDDNGGYVGKTYLQNKIKELKTEDKTEQTEDDYANKIIKTLMNVPEELDAGKIFMLVKDFVNASKSV